MMSNTDLLAAYWTIAGDVYPFAPDELSPFPFADRVEEAARAGYKGIGLIHADLMKQIETLGVKEMRRILEANDMPHVELEFLVDWYTDGEQRVASDKMRDELFGAAAELGARNVKIAPQFETTEIDMPKVVESFSSVCNVARQNGTKVALEIMPFSNVATLERALEIVSTADHPDGGLLLDIWHIARGNIPYEAVAKIPSKHVVSVELDDADAKQRGTLWEDTIYERRLCGEGVLNPPAFIDAIRQTGFDSFWSVEIISKQHRVLPLREAAERSYATTIAQFNH